MVCFVFPESWCSVRWKPSLSVLLCPHFLSSSSFSADIFQLFILPAVPRWLCQCCHPIEFLSASSLPPSVSLLCLSVVSLFLPACFTSLSPLFSPSVFIFHHLWIVCTLLFLWSLNIFFGSLVLGFLSLCVMLLPCIPLFSLVFFIPCDQFLCQLVFANPWPQCSSIFSSFSSLHKPITSLCNTQNPSCFLCADTLAHV